MRFAFALYAGGQKFVPSRETLKHGNEGFIPPSHDVALFNRKPRRWEKVERRKTEKEGTCYETSKGSL